MVVLAHPSLSQDHLSCTMSTVTQMRRTTSLTGCLPGWRIKWRSVSMWANKTKQFVCATMKSTVSLSSYNAGTWREHCPSQQHGPCGMGGYQRCSCWQFWHLQDRCLRHWGKLQLLWISSVCIEGVDSLREGTCVTRTWLNRKRFSERYRDTEVLSYFHGEFLLLLK